jgi:GGDEF domain-containing protein
VAKSAISPHEWSEQCRPIAAFLGVFAEAHRSLLATARLEGYPDVPVTVSVGVALYGRDGVTAQELLAAADRAMYVDKRTRDRTVVLR